jgi:hypothetical protein
LSLFYPRSRLDQEIYGLIKGAGAGKFPRVYIEPIAATGADPRGRTGKPSGQFLGGWLAINILAMGDQPGASGGEVTWIFASE